MPDGALSNISPPGRSGWWLLLAIVLFVVGAWPPDQDKSLLIKGLNWVVDPLNRLPILPEQLGFGVGDDPIAVEAHDAQVRLYDSLYSQGGWTRMRLQLKVASDPFNRSTERQLLLALAVVAGFVVWRLSGGLRRERL